jgi:hypothetical protein
VALLTRLLQFVVQLPHCVSVFVRVSQPELLSGARQWLKPALHAHLHKPAPQLGVAFNELQTVPHVPQWSLLVSGSVHVLAQQFVFAPVHAPPQLPQLKMSFVTSMHRFAQHFCPAGQDAASPVHFVAHAPLGLHSRFTPRLLQSAVTLH